MTLAALTSAVGEVVGSPVVATASLGGNAAAGTHRCELYDGRVLFVKTHPAGAAMFEAEAAGLAWLAAPDALPIAEVVAVGSRSLPFLALRFEECHRPRVDYDEALGRGLANLHRSGAPTYGWDRDNFVGALPQANEQCHTWPQFYRERRLFPLVRDGVDRGLLPRATADRLGAIMDRLETLCGPPVAPARLHGDLWSGNVICGASGCPLLVDPSCYGGHREIDLAMMRLFGGFTPRCFAAYAESFALSAGHQSRVALYQLYPLLVHAHLFGRSYLGQVDAAARSIV